MLKNLATVSSFLIGAVVLVIAGLYLLCKIIISGPVQNFAKDYTETAEAIKSDFQAARRAAADAKAARKANATK